jgi:hypothetical protein
VTCFLQEISPKNQPLAAHHHLNRGIHLRQSDRKCERHVESNPGWATSNSRAASENPDQPAHIGIAFVIAPTPVSTHLAMSKMTKTEKAKTRNEVNLTSENY